MLANQLHPFAGEVCDACRGPHLAGWQPREAGIAGLGLPCLSGALANQREAVAFPRISSRVYGYPKAQALKAVLELPLESAVKINEGRRLHLRPSFAPGTKSSDYFSFAPSWKALATFSPSTRYALWMGSKVMGRSLSGSMVPFSSSTDSSALTLTISPTSRQLSGS